MEYAPNERGLREALSVLARAHGRAFAVARDGSLVAEAFSEVVNDQSAMRATILAQYDFENSAVQAFRCPGSETAGGELRVVALGLPNDRMLCIVGTEGSDWEDLEVDLIHARIQVLRSLQKEPDAPSTPGSQGGHGAEAVAGVAEYLRRKRPQDQES